MMLATLADDFFCGKFEFSLFKIKLVADTFQFILMFGSRALLNEPERSVSTEPHNLYTTTLLIKDVLHLRMTYLGQPVL